jgi:hypothetical protein
VTVYSTIENGNAPKSRVHDAVKLHEQPVAHGLDQPPVMIGDLRLEHLVQVGLKPRARPFVVSPAETAVAGDIGDHHRGEPALHEVWSGLSGRQN